MTFSEALQCLLEGKRVCCKTWAGHDYIELVDNKIVDEQGFPYSIGDRLYEAEWNLYQPKVTVGALLSHLEDRYRVVWNNRGRLDLVDIKTWRVFIGDIYKDRLDDVIKSYGMKVIKYSN
ncbi:hypothetical protein HOU39_gp126 [Lactobacillus phage Iacchus]|uniref:Uncharacterized protein n=1 Tax=Lactobacillus phage Iacchus TaxID=2315483 RepID=A0A3Q8HVZ2_9CAUD|nr:hypothetical protein HOU39_gp126 [Lactobacillus phage Iacchus]AYH92020.1 hypothetical protein [Lactobacillus phage Iacchus]AYH92192.1 hypothetical protein [Lactobacillus phage Dionysus]